MTSENKEARINALIEIWFPHHLELDRDKFETSEGNQILYEFCKIIGRTTLPEMHYRKHGSAFEEQTMRGRLVFHFREWKATHRISFKRETDLMLFRLTMG